MQTEHWTRFRTVRMISYNHYGNSRAERQQAMCLSSSFLRSPVAGLEER